MSRKDCIDDIVEECTMWGTLIECRYVLHDKPIATRDEQIAYDVYYFCIALDSELMTGFLSQSNARQQSMRESLLALGLKGQVENAANAAKALAQSGLSLDLIDNAKKRKAILKLLEPFGDKYLELRAKTYKRLKKFIYSSKIFRQYAEVIQRADREGLNIYNPEIWK